MNCALVTGASRGLGRAIAVQLAKDHGLHILVNYASNQAAAEETLAEIQADGGSGELLHFNVQHKAEVDEALNGWREKNEDKFIGVLVNNAGITRDGLFMWMPEKDWDDVLNISVKGLYNVTQNAIQQMLREALRADCEHRIGVGYERCGRGKRTIRRRRARSSQLRSPSRRRLPNGKSP